MIKLKQNRSLFSAHMHNNHITSTNFFCGIQHLEKQFYHTACLSTCTPSHNLGLFCITTLLPDVQSWRQLKHCAWSLIGGSQWSCSDWIFYMQGGNQQICWQCQLNRKARLGKHLPSPPPPPKKTVSGSLHKFPHQSELSGAEDFDQSCPKQGRRQKHKIEVIMRLGHGKPQTDRR